MPPVVYVRCATQQLRDSYVSTQSADALRCCWCWASTGRSCASGAGAHPHSFQRLTLLLRRLPSSLLLPQVVARVVCERFGGAYDTEAALDHFWHASSAAEKRRTR